MKSALQFAICWRSRPQRLDRGVGPTPATAHLDGPPRDRNTRDKAHGRGGRNLPPSGRLSKEGSTDCCRRISSHGRR